MLVRYERKLKVSVFHDQDMIVVVFNASQHQLLMFDLADKTTTINNVQSLMQINVLN